MPLNCSVTVQTFAIECCSNVAYGPCVRVTPVVVPQRNGGRHHLPPRRRPSATTSFTPPLTHPAIRRPALPHPGVVTLFANGWRGRPPHRLLPSSRLAPPRLRSLRAVFCLFHYVFRRPAAAAVFSFFCVPSPRLPSSPSGLPHCPPPPPRARPRGPRAVGHAPKDALPLPPPPSVARAWRGKGGGGGRARHRPNHSAGPPEPLPYGAIGRCGRAGIVGRGGGAASRGRGGPAETAWGDPERVARRHPSVGCPHRQAKGVAGAWR